VQNFVIISLTVLPRLSDNRAQTDAYSAWDEWLVDCKWLVSSSKRPVLKIDNADLLPFPGLELGVVCVEAGDCAELWSAHIWRTLCFVAKQRDAKG
jgi:hypothetical protein